MAARGILYVCSELDMECLWFYFADSIQNVLKEVKQHWNTHLMSGKQGLLFYLPILNGGNKYKISVPEAEISYAHEHVVELQHSNIYQD